MTDNSGVLFGWELECYREHMGDIHGVAVVASEYPSGHSLYYAYGFVVEGGVTPAYNAYVCDAAVFSYYELNNNTALSFLSDGFCGV